MRLWIFKRGIPDVTSLQIIQCSFNPPCRSRSRHDTQIHIFKQVQVQAALLDQIWPRFTLWSSKFQPAEEHNHIIYKRANFPVETWFCPRACPLWTYHKFSWNYPFSITTAKTVVFTDVPLPETPLPVGNAASVCLHCACLRSSGGTILLLNQWPIQIHASCWHLTNRARKVNGIPYVCTLQWPIVSQCSLAGKPN